MGLMILPWHEVPGKAETMNPSRRVRSEAVPLIFNLSVACLTGNAYPQGSKSHRSLRDGTETKRKFQALHARLRSSVPP